jgi:hypothetical protein
MTAVRNPKFKLDEPTRSLEDGTLGRQPGQAPGIRGPSETPSDPGKLRTRKRLQAIRGAQKALQQAIRELQEKLAHVDNMPTTQPWITLKRASSIEELRSPHRTLKEALEDDLEKLRRELSGLRARERKVIREPAMRAKRDFDKRLEKVLRKAEQEGEIDESELVELQEGSLEVLDKFIEILDEHPSTENMRGVLSGMETAFLLGAEPDGAQRALGEASTKLQGAAENKFRQRPTTDNLEKFLKSWGLTQAVGGEEQHQRQGWSSVDTTHPVAPGDTLAGISRHYYGDAGFWDIIYLENYGVIGNDVKSLRVDTVLHIP